MRLSALKRLRVEDFAADDQRVVSRLSLVINPIIDQLAVLFDKRLDFINLNRQLKTLTVKVNASGTPTNSIQIVSELKTKAAGINVIRAINAVSSNSYPSSHPFVSFTEVESVITINNITGLTANTNYEITLEIIGQNTS